jgi:predicted anti-sigma-YlaC factor YlaD
MPFSKCRDVLDRVSEIVDGEAGAVARARFHAHLAMCEDCTLYFEQFKAVHDAAGVVQPEDVPADFDSVMGSLLGKLKLDDEPPA